MFGLGIGEVVVILIVALIFIGPKKLPGLAKGLGKGVREFQGALNGINHDMKKPQEHKPLDTPTNIVQNESPKASSEESKNS